jgi:hypothetical protein
MRAVIDTSSLLAFVRYYLPFDNDGKLNNFFKEKFETGEIIVLDKVFEQSRFVAKGIVVDKLKFLNDKTKHIKTETILPEQKFFNRLENELCNRSQKKKLTNEEFEKQKNQFLEDADAKLILYCELEKNKNKLEIDKPILVTEETRNENDNKLFKKLPEICQILHIDYCTLPVLLKDRFRLKMSNFLK